MEVLSFVFCSLLLRLRSSKISPIFSSCLVIFVTRGAVTCSELLYSALTIFNGLNMPRPPCEGVDPALLSLDHQVGFFLSGWGLGAVIYRQSSSGCSRSKMLFMVQDKNVHLLAKPWVSLVPRLPPLARKQLLRDL